MHQSLRVVIVIVICLNLCRADDSNGTTTVEPGIFTLSMIISYSSFILIYFEELILYSIQ